MQELDFMLMLKLNRERKVREDAYAFVTESNKIEGIHRVTSQEVEEYIRFVELDEMTVADLAMFVGVYEPSAILRVQSGCNVYVGDHEPLPGGQHILYRLDDIVAHANSGAFSVYENHVEYERLHPFSDGNGRSGRALWAWQMRKEGQFGQLSLGFLHAFYYQTLGQAHAKKAANGEAWM